MSNKLLNNEELSSISSKNFKELQELYYKKVDSNSIIPFIGAGLSNPTGIDTWTNLLINMALPYFDEDEIFEIKHELKLNNHLDIASKIYNKINDVNLYHEFLNKQFEQSRTMTTSTIIKITHLFHSIITTNYDTSIEEAYNTINFINNETNELSKQALPHFNSRVLHTNKCVIYLHGYKNKNKYLLKREDYEFFYPTISGKKDCPRGLERFLETLILENNIIFFGFSFDDEYFYKYFKHVIMSEEVDQKRLKNANYDEEKEEMEHYAFIKLKDDHTGDKKIDKYNEESNTILFNKLKEINIKPIYYKDRHTDLETNYLNKLKDYDKDSILNISTSLEGVADAI